MLLLTYQHVPEPLEDISELVDTDVLRNVPHEERAGSLQRGGEGREGEISLSCANLQEVESFTQHSLVGPAPPGGRGVAQDPWAPRLGRAETEVGHAPQGGNLGSGDEGETRVSTYKVDIYHFTIGPNTSTEADTHTHTLTHTHTCTHTHTRTHTHTQPDLAPCVLTIFVQQGQFDLAAKQHYALSLLAGSLALIRPGRERGREGGREEGGREREGERTG